MHDRPALASAASASSALQKFSESFLPLSSLKIVVDAALVA
jgi:hypothetical protein